MENERMTIYNVTDGIFVAKWCKTKEYPRHSHAFYEIEYIISGEGSITINNEKHPFRPNTLFFFSPLDIEFMEFETEATILNIAINPECISDTLLNNLGVSDVIYDYDFPYADKLCNEYEGDNIYKSLVIENIVNIILVDIARSIKNKKSTNSNKGSVVIQKAMRYIQQHYKEKLTLDTVSNYVFLNSAYFSALFKKCTNTSFLEYLQTLRLAYAEHLLVHSKTAITDVAYAVGFSSFSSFSRSFKQKYGVTPSEYRKKHTAF